MWLRSMMLLGLFIQNFHGMKNFISLIGCFPMRVLPMTR